jgi:hypothetical protein
MTTDRAQGPVCHGDHRLQLYLAHRGSPTAAREILKDLR